MHISSRSALPQLRPATLLFPTPGNATARRIVGFKAASPAKYHDISHKKVWNRNNLILNVEVKSPKDSKKEKTYNSRSSYILTYPLICLSYIHIHITYIYIYILNIHLVDIGISMWVKVLISGTYTNAVCMWVCIYTYLASNCLHLSTL